MAKILSENDKDLRQSNRFEKQLLHPATKEYLRRLDYKFSYEANAPKYGRCDFVIFPRNGFTVVAECKLELSWHSVGQVLGYKLQFEADEAWIIVPEKIESSKLENHVFDLCNELGIIVVEINIALAFPDREELMSANRKLSKRRYWNDIRSIQALFSVSTEEAKIIRKRILTKISDAKIDDVIIDFDFAMHELMKDYRKNLD